jgi:hypothetical protein
MKRVFLTTKVALLLAFIVSFNMASAVTYTAKKAENYYIGVAIPYQTIQGDFNGTSLLGAGVEDFSIPSIDAALGVGLVGSFSRVRQNTFGYGTEVSYQWTRHDTRWLVWPEKATFQTLNFDLKLIYGAAPYEPYIVTGLAILWLDIGQEGLGVPESQQSIDFLSDARYYGFGMNIGLGVNISLHRNIVLTTRTAFRWTGFHRVRGVGQKYRISETINGNGMNLTAGLLFNILRR